MAEAVLADLARQSPPHQRFHDPLLAVVGSRTGYLPNATLSACNDLYLEIIRQAGLDPDNLPEGFALKGRDPGRGVYQQVRIAYHKLIPAEATRRHKPHGEWGLTPAGIERALLLTSESLDQALLLALNRAGPIVPNESFRERVLKNARALDDQLPKIPPGGVDQAYLKLHAQGFTLAPRARKWRVSRKGAERAEHYCNQDRRAPFQSFFRDAVLRFLGRQTSNTAGVPVRLTRVEHHEIIRESGLDPNALPDGYVLKEQGGSPNKGVYAQVRKALHYLSHPRRIKVPLIVSGPRRKEWALTEAGVQVLPGLAGTNMTARWVKEHLTPQPGEKAPPLLKLLRSSLAQRCPVSASAGQIEDHIQEFILRFIQRDGLRSRLLGGKKITYTHLATYATRSAYNDIRNRATEPVCREVFGARTEQERKKAKELAKEREEEGRTESGPVPGRKVTAEGGACGGSRTEGLLYIQDPSATHDDLWAARRSFERVWVRISEAMRKSKPRAWKRYLGLLWLQLVEGLSVKEIASLEGVTDVRAATMIQEAKKAVRPSGMKSGGPGQRISSGHFAQVERPAFGELHLGLDHAPDEVQNYLAHLVKRVPFPTKGSHEVEAVRIHALRPEAGAP